MPFSGAYAIVYTSPSDKLNRSQGVSRVACPVSYPAERRLHHGSDLTLRLQLDEKSARELVCRTKNEKNALLTND